MQTMTCGDRLGLLRDELARRGLQGFVVPLTDEHLSEYGGDYAQRLAWLTGFQGSGGWAVVLADKAAVFVDGRYTLQVRQQVDQRLWSFQSLLQTNIADWLGEHATAESRIGYDPWLHTKRWVAETRAKLAQRGATLTAVDTNPIDSIWLDRPLPSMATVIVHPEQLVGQSSAEKRTEIARWLSSHHADAVVLSSLDSIAWTFNIRGQDIEYTPVVRAYALIAADGSADLFVEPEKLTDQSIRHLGRAVRLHARTEFVRFLNKLTGKTIAVDPDRSVAAIFETLEATGANILEARDPVVLPKAIKNATEIAGHRAAHARDGAALCRFLHWLSIEAPNGGLTELSAAQKALEFRQQMEKFQGLSFATISAAGPNSALPHYRVTPATSRPIGSNTMYLVDSGGQYLDGTTDVTRTIAIGVPTPEMRDRFTRVLKGHIALASAIFPSGTLGIQLDALARQYLWAAGLDYGHATGHGVGTYLAVHEGPQRIGHRGECITEPIVAGMILSNEPGYYKTDDYGIRIENLMLTVPRQIAGAEREMLGFETLTAAPLDRVLIDDAMLTSYERSWVDDYHAMVLRIVGPQLQGNAKTWLMEATRPLV